MSLRSMLPTLLLAFALSILVGVLAAARGASVPLALAAGLFAVQVLFALVRINEPLWRATNGRSADADWAWSNTVLAALVYAWGATAMFAIYSLSGLAWRHWWQYGAGMTLLACLALLCANYLAKRRGSLEHTTARNILIGNHGGAGRRRRCRARLSRRFREAANGRRRTGPPITSSSPAASRLC